MEQIVMDKFTNGAKFVTLVENGKVVGHSFVPPKGTYKNVVVSGSLIGFDKFNRRKL